MASVEMEVFSNIQLIIITILMLLGGEIFTSMLELQLTKFKLLKQLSLDNSTVLQLERQKPDTILVTLGDSLRYNSIKCLSYVVLGYFLVVHLFGSISIFLYISLISSARKVLKSKGIQISTFAVFTTVSTFANCGFVPTNENMTVFKKNSGLLLLLIPQTLIGNTLYPLFLRFFIWVLDKSTKRVEFGFILRNSKEMGYTHLMSNMHTLFLGVTVIGFVLVQFMFFCCLEWNSEAMHGLSFYQKLVASLFQTVNSRHTGESVFDLSIVSPSILVLFLVMMYLPPYTSFMPRKEEDEKISRHSKEGKSPKENTFLQYLTFSQLSYLAIFIILICITEKDKMMEDPLNFNVLNITIEVISAYGNVGFSAGYSCERQLKPESYCENRWYGFVGKWSSKGKFILILVMLFGRLKKFSFKGGKAWKLSS